MKRYKKIVQGIIAGVDVVTILFMTFIGYSYFIDPSAWSLASILGLFFPLLLLINLLLLAITFFIAKKLVWIPIIGFLICAPPIRTYCPLNFSKDVPKDAIKVLSYNTLSYGGTKDDNEDNEILQYIKNCDADLVCLQEAGATHVSIETIKKCLNQYTDLDTASVDSANYCSLLILSKFPIIGSEKISATPIENGGHAFWIKMDNDTVIVINCHLKSNELTPEDKEQYQNVLRDIKNKTIKEDSLRMESKKIAHKLVDASIPRSRQAKAIAEYIRIHNEKKIIVCGDFNDNPLSYVHHTIAKDLQDCYVATGNGPGFSFNEKGFYVRIDNILCSHHFQPYNCQIDREIAKSDHYPIHCCLKNK